MTLKLVIILSVLCSTHGRYCPGETQTINSTVLSFTREILSQAAWEEYGHFAFSPIATWLQLAALVQGASGGTLEELSKLTGAQSDKCFEEKVINTLKNIHTGLKYEFARCSLIVIDELLEPAKHFTSKVNDIYGIEVLPISFYRVDAPAKNINDVIKQRTIDVIENAFSDEDFSNTTMILSDNVYIRTAWQYSFPEDNTKIEDFYDKVKGTDEIVQTKIGEVNMMNLVGSFNMMYLPDLEAKVIEIPCQSGFSMLVFLPTPRTNDDIWVNDVISNKKFTNLDEILANITKGGPKLVDLKLPRFKIQTTYFDISRILRDMGLHKMFSATAGEFIDICKYTMYVSSMRHIADIEITEYGVNSELLDVPSTVSATSSEKFYANHPFVYLIVDKNSTPFVPFGGAYSIPSLVET